MKEHIVNLANEFVRATEEKIWLDLHQHLEESSHRSVMCGCPNCKREALGAQDAWEWEAERVFGTPQFQDPEVIPKNAKIFERKEKP